MVIALTAVERKAIVAKYQLAAGDAEDLGNVVSIENGTEPTTFAVNDPVMFTRSDGWSRKRYRGTVVAFVRLTDQSLGRQSFGVVLVEDEHSHRRQYRILLEELDHDPNPHS